MNHPLDNCLREIEWLRAEWAKSKNRVEALKAALRAVDHTLSVHGHVDADTPLHDRLRAALAPEQEIGCGKSVIEPWNDGKEKE